MQITRRNFFATVGTVTAIASAPRLMAGSTSTSVAPINAKNTDDKDIKWFSSTQRANWTSLAASKITDAGQLTPFDYNFDIQLDKPKQTIEGFGAAFSEKGWEALTTLDSKKQSAVLQLLFDAHVGANFNLCRTPIGANDFALKWYSYDETEADFDLKHFSIDNDKKTLIPFIQAAQKIRPDLAIWASPWSPPTWMKKNKHYAMTPNWPGGVVNGLQPHQVGEEGKDYFILETKYLKAYAKYFRKYVEAYRKQFINIFAVMPQNEFNSAQPFPSCCWTPEGLNQFIPILAEEMTPLGVDVMLGTLERGNAALVDKIMSKPASAAVLKGVGVQWAGKHALPLLKNNYPQLKIWGTEQECGAGTNDWHYAKYAWNLIKTFLNNGASVYQYWNMILSTDVHSTWGWPQNSLITIDTKNKTFSLNPEYYVMRHLSGLVQPGAKFIPASSFTGYENQLAFLNPDGSVAIIIQNEMAEELTVKAKLGSKLVEMKLAPDSYNSLLIPKQAYS